MVYPYGIPAGMFVLDYKTGDVNGDGIMDHVYLTGQKTNIRVELAIMPI